MESLQSEDHLAGLEGSEHSHGIATSQKVGKTVCSCLPIECESDIMSHTCRGHVNTHS